MSNESLTTIPGKDRNTAISVYGEEGEIQITVKGNVVRMDAVSFERFVNAGQRALSTRREWVLVGGRPVRVEV